MARSKKKPFEALVADLDSPDYKVRRNATRDLGKLGDKRALPYLNAMLKDKTINVRSRAIYLQHLGK